MAGQKVSVNLEVSDQTNSIKKRTSEAKELNKELSKAAQSAEKAMAPVGATRAPRGEGTAYGQARGTTGSTGASARDFANQAQGLGGLVRTYATVAANIYAVGAAFNTLKEAASTTTMIKGLDQLGAASGIALGSMSRRLVAATDGAISLREAVSTVAKASAAGLSGKQINEIGQIAKASSLALGVDMTDAISRLTRGITKLEPELLDELGIFTKIGPATEEYARKLGKSSSALTDFERRQAFANAVLEEGRKKFGDILLEGNPYQKLEASIRNMAQAGLELVNKVLIPIVNLLSNNQGLLAGLLGLTGIRLIRMAIPALTNWREELIKSAQTSSRVARQVNEAWGARGAQNAAFKVNLPEIEKNVNAAKNVFSSAQKELLDFQKQGGLKNSLVMQRIAAGTYGQDPRDVARLNEQIRKLGKSSDDNAQTGITYLRNYKNAYRELTVETNKQTQALDAQEKALRRKGWGDWLREKNSAIVSARAERLGALSRVGANVQEGGLWWGLSQLKEETKDFSPINKFTTRVTGGFAGIATSVAMAGRALGAYGMAIGATVSALAVIRSSTSDARKEQELYSAAIEENKEAVKTNILVTDKYKDTITSASIIARGNSFKTLSDNIDSITKAFDRAQEKHGLFDKTWEFILDWLPIVNSSFQDLAEQVGDNITQQLSLVPEGPAKQVIREKLSNIFETSDISEKGLKGAAERLGERRLSQAARDAGKLFLEQRNAAQQAGEGAQGFADKLKGANEAADKLLQTLAVTDPIAQFGQSMVSLGAEFAKVTGSAEQTIAAFKKLLESPKALKLIDPQAIVDLNKVRPELDKIDKVLQDTQKEMSNAQTRIDLLKKDLAAEMTPDEAAGGAAPILGPTRMIRGQIAEQQRIYSTAAQQAATAKLSLDRFQSDLLRVGNNTMQEGFRLMASAAERATRQGIIDTRKSLLQGFSGPEAVRASAELELQSIQIRKEEIVEVAKLAEVMHKSNVLAQARMTQEQADRLKADVERGGGTLTGDSLTLYNTLIRRAEGLTAVASGLNITKGKTSVSGQYSGGLNTMAPGTGITPENLDPVALAQYNEGLVYQQNLKQKIAQEDAKANQIIRSARVQAAKAADDRNRQQIAERNASLDLSLEQKRTEYGILEILTEEQAITLEKLETDKLIRDRALQDKEFEDSRADINRRREEELSLLKSRNTSIQSSNVLKALYDEERALGNRLATLEETREREDNIAAEKRSQERTTRAIARTEKDITNEKIKQEQLIALQDLQAETTLQLLNLEYDLEKTRNRGIYQSEEVLRLRELDVRQIQNALQYEREKVNLTRRYTQDILQYLQEYNSTRQKDPDAGDKLRQRVASRQDLLEAEQQSAERINDVRTKTIDIEKGLTPAILRNVETLKSLEGVAVGVVDKMTDAFIEFAKTGKFNFKEMANAIIADIGRIIIRAQMMKFMESTFGENWASGIAGRIGSLIGIGGKNPASTGAQYGGFDGMSGLDFNFLPGSAKGNIFNSTGMQKFAQGGMFTNKIVAQPTLFKFAQGTGLMGEAGPEAIMPLRRDGEGNLGVIGKPQSGSVEVVVNNYSGERAEARETVDSRGNRKIEVVVGEMVAQEVGRKNSPMQQSLQGNFNTKPALIRR